MENTELVQEQPRVSPCLLRNWLEERAAVSLDSGPPGLTTKGQVHRHGHKGILSTQLLANMAKSTTHQDSYRRPGSDNTRQHTGLREEKLKTLLYHKYSQDILEELVSPIEETKVTESTTRRDYQVEGFLAQAPTPSKRHDYRTEQAVTFWTDNMHGITGVSDIRTRDSPFKRSSAFTTPISHYLDQPAPHTMENYPNM
ncbi:sperm-associated antigen 8 [Bufo bufo]|uniref:sperm-associated antigen 8 n=1 Tax=Bufo bufo TaxID=8384 RepID=UPI001ABEBFD2|nr:sperm-associated antigen 8 [Bufo bufo]